MDMKKERLQDGIVLYGVPKVEYGPEGCTPYPMCVRACANYLGQDIPYHFVMAASGAAFRLTWDTTSWNAGNVDAVFTFDDPLRSFRTAIEALGRSFHLIERSGKAPSSKEEFITFIRERIDSGIPCIALGIIGPPEACLITGYREDGAMLLGWNFFQDNPEFNAGATFDDSGYFISRTWWENPCTTAVMAMGEQISPIFEPQTVLHNAIEALSGRIAGNYAKGLDAYDAWKRALLDEAQFPRNAVMPLLFERLMCQCDAMDCLMDGRHNAALYFEALKEELPGHHRLCATAKAGFEEVLSCVKQMAELLDGYARGEEQLHRLADADVRQNIARLIDRCKAADNSALTAMKSLHAALQQA